MSRLVLFDIDETLIASDGAGRRALERAMAALFGRAIATDGHNFSGKTDPQICREVLFASGISSDVIDGSLEKLFQMYVPLLEEEVSCAKLFRLHQGVLQLLEALRLHPEAFLGLLTGNIEPGARTKLKPFDLNRYFPVGAYGSDNHDRMGLPAVAHRRAESTFKHLFKKTEIVIIGDARNDILCATGYGARCLAVATGKTSQQALMELQPDYLFDSLSNTDQVLAAIFAN
jgi:phosphoglycolate phosphatase